MLEARMRNLITLVHNSNSLITALSIWLGSTVSHKLIYTRTRAITAHEATALSLPVGTLLPYRQGELWAELGGAHVRIAIANALVVPQRMPLEVVELIRHVPLGAALQPHGVHRLSHPAVWATGRGVRLAATLLIHGEPWALTDETVDQEVAEHQCPGTSVA